MKNQIIKTIEQEKIIAIVRGVNPEDCLMTAKALYDGGIKLVEITFNQKSPELWEQTAQAISLIARELKDKICVGAGTVTSAELVDIAYKAGAKYIISPDTNEEVIKRCNQLNLVSIPGALTPTEALFAHRTGADFVKLFPVGNLGTSYVKALCAPLNHIKFLAVGGINENNAKDFMKAGAVGVGVGGNLANKAWIENGEFYKITELAKTFVQNINN